MVPISNQWKTGIKALWDELVKQLKQDCDHFITLFSENPTKNNY
mgnify:CR=1 FL=1